LGEIFLHSRWESFLLNVLKLLCNKLPGNFLDNLEKKKNVSQFLAAEFPSDERIRQPVFCTNFLENSREAPVFLIIFLENMRKAPVFLTIFLENMKEAVDLL